MEPLQPVEMTPEQLKSYQWNIALAQQQSQMHQSDANMYNTPFQQQQYNAYQLQNMYGSAQANQQYAMRVADGMRNACPQIIELPPPEPVKLNWFQQELEIWKPFFQYARGWFN
jgi:hypothetical protein